MKGRYTYGKEDRQEDVPVCYYKTIKPELFAQIKPDYLCDRKWDTDAPESFDGIPVISRENLYKLENSLVIISGGGHHGPMNL